jgi:hypothetical protein
VLGIVGLLILLIGIIIYARAPEHIGN